MTAKREQIKFHWLPAAAAGLYALVLMLKPLSYYARIHWTDYMLSGLIESLVPGFLCLLMTLIALRFRLTGGLLFLLTWVSETVETLCGNTPSLFLESLPCLFIGLLFIFTRPSNPSHRYA